MSVLYIRNVDPSVIAKLTEIAKKRKISRNKLVCILLEKYAYLDIEEELNNHYLSLTNTMIEAIKYNSSELESLKRKIDELNANCQKK